MRTHFLQEETLNPSPLEDNAIRVVVIVKVEAFRYAETQWSSSGLERDIDIDRLKTRNP